MVDTPRFNPVLAKRLQELGGVKYIFLTHKVSMDCAGLGEMGQGTATLSVRNCIARLCA